MMKILTYSYPNEVEALSDYSAAYNVIYSNKQKILSFINSINNTGGIIVKGDMEIIFEGNVIVFAYKIINFTTSLNLLFSIQELQTLIRYENNFFIFLSGLIDSYRIKSNLSVSITPLQKNKKVFNKYRIPKTVTGNVSLLAQYLHNTQKVKIIPPFTHEETQEFENNGVRRNGVGGANIDSEGMLASVLSTIGRTVDIRELDPTNIGLNLKVTNCFNITKANIGQYIEYIPASDYSLEMEMKSYEHVTDFKDSKEVKGKLGITKPFAFTGSDTYKQLDQHTRTTKSQTVHGKINCTYGKARLITIEDLEKYINKEFATDFKRLSTDKQAIDFISKYGTHYISAGAFGGMGTSLFCLTSEDIVKIADKSHDITLELKSIFATATASYKLSDDTKVQTLSKDFKIKVKILGGTILPRINPDTGILDYSAWVDTILKRPVPINISLTQIEELVSLLPDSEYKSQKALLVAAYMKEFGHPPADPVELNQDFRIYAINNTLKSNKEVFELNSFNCGFQLNDKWTEPYGRVTFGIWKKWAPKKPNTPLTVMLTPKQVETSSLNKKDSLKAKDILAKGYPKDIQFGKDNIWCLSTGNLDFNAREVIAYDYCVRGIRTAGYIGDHEINHKNFDPDNITPVANNRDTNNIWFKISPAINLSGQAISKMYNNFCCTIRTALPVKKSTGEVIYVAGASLTISKLVVSDSLLESTVNVFTFKPQNHIGVFYLSNTEWDDYVGNA